jgi:hypothetical protein
MNGILCQKGLVNSLRVLSQEARQLFRAYTRQLRQAPARDGNKNSDPVMMRRGYEQIELSEEALSLSASKTAPEEEALKTEEDLKKK